MRPPLNLREFIAKIDAAEGVQQVLATVDPLLEIAAITDRCCKSAAGNVALLFESVSGSEFMVATNLFGSERRICLALGLESLADLTVRFDAILSNLPGGRSAEKLAALASSSVWQAAAPVIEAEPAPVDDRIKSDLAGLPFLKAAPLDGCPDHAGRFMTLPVVITAAPDGALNCGMYRAAILGPDRLVIS